MEDNDQQKRKLVQGFMNTNGFWSFMVSAIVLLILWFVLPIELSLMANQFARIAYIYILVAELFFIPIMYLRFKGFNKKLNKHSIDLIPLNSRFRLLYAAQMIAISLLGLLLLLVLKETNFTNYFIFVFSYFFIFLVIMRMLIKETLAN